MVIYLRPFPPSSAWHRFLELPRNVTYLELHNNNKIKKNNGILYSASTRLKEDALLQKTTRS